MAARRREREALIERARAFVREPATERTIVAAVVFGSVARGDFNVWSDVDLLLIRRDPAPGGAADPALAAPSGVQVVSWTPEEFVDALRRGNPIAREAVTVGVVLHGARSLEALAQRARA